MYAIVFVQHLNCLILRWDVLIEYYISDLASEGTCHLRLQIVVLRDTLGRITGNKSWLAVLLYFKGENMDAYKKNNYYEEVELYSRLTGKDGANIPVEIIGAYLDGYEKGKEEKTKSCEGCKRYTYNIIKNIPEYKKAPTMLMYNILKALSEIPFTDKERKKRKRGEK